MLHYITGEYQKDCVFITCDVVVLPRTERKGLTIVVVSSLLPDAVGAAQS